MKPQTRVALDKLIADSAKQARAELTAGKYSIDETVTLHISGELTVGEDYDQRIANKARPWGLFHEVYREYVAMCEATGRVGVDLKTLVARSLELDPEIEKRAQREADGFAAELKEATMTHCSGKTTVKGSITELRPAEAA